MGALYHGSRADPQGLQGAGAGPIGALKCVGAPALGERASAPREALGLLTC
jgi:hypothetical protein